MTAQRLAPNQLLIFLPLEAAREAVWQVFAQNKVMAPVIDVNRNMVVGSTGVTMGSYGQTVSAQFETRADGVVVSIKSEPQVQGTIDFGSSKRHARNLTTAIETLLNGGWSPRADVGVPSAPTFNAPPIALATGEIASPLPSGPIYGIAPPVKRGNGVLLYGIIGMLCCQILGPFAVVRGFKALKEYKENDPGDKTLVIIGMVCGGIGSVLLVGRVLSFVIGLGT